jgi:hypothetical protein
LVVSASNSAVNASDRRHRQAACTGLAVVVVVVVVVVEEEEEVPAGVERRPPRPMRVNLPGWL